MDRVPVLEQTGKVYEIEKRIESLKSRNYTVRKGFTITGEAPKEFVRVYEYSTGCRKRNISTWPLYIAKTGHKWYPVESIVEQINSDIGDFLNINVADSRLAVANGQLRFFSKYFLKNSETLVHGANIIAGYIDDKTFFEQVEKEKKEGELFTVDTVRAAIEYNYPRRHKEIYSEFLKMLLFDAFVGINDRHFYNWGVIVDIKKKKSPRFSPIYDSARSLFWNFSEDKVNAIMNDKSSFEGRMHKYIKRSRPRIGIEGKTHVNHFDMAQYICRNSERELQELQKWAHTLFSEQNFRRVGTFIKNKYSHLLSSNRLLLIEKYFDMRGELFKEKLLGGK